MRLAVRVHPGRRGGVEVSDVFEKLRDVVAYAYKMGYHEHGVDLVTEASDALGEWIDKTTALQSRLDVALRGCRAVLGLFQLIRGRDDLPATLREALTDNHRIAEAEAAVAQE